MRFLLSVFILICSSVSSAATFKIFAAETPPLLERNGDGVKGLSGIFGTLVSEQIIRSNKVHEFEVVWVPWKRALSETLKSKNGIFFPLGRSPDREETYEWLTRLGSLESWIYTTNPKIKIKNPKDLTKYRIGFLNGSMREMELKKIFANNPDHLEGLSTDVDNYKKLISGRIDIWIAQTEVFEEGKKLYSTESDPKVYDLAKFLDQEVWIASSPSMDGKLKTQIRSIFKDLKEVRPTPNH